MPGLEGARQAARVVELLVVVAAGADAGAHRDLGSLVELSMPVATSSNAPSNTRRLAISSPVKLLRGSTGLRAHMHKVKHMYTYNASDRASA